MNHDWRRLSKTASALSLWPILGLLGGVILGAVLARFQRRDELASLGLTIQFAVIGFFLGCVPIQILAIRFRWKQLHSVQGLALLVAVAAILAWYAATILLGLLGI